MGLGLVGGLSVLLWGQLQCPPVFGDRVPAMPPHPVPPSPCAPCPGQVQGTGGGHEGAVREETRLR